VVSTATPSPRGRRDDTATPDLAFWSAIDIDGLRNRLHREVIGQREVIAGVIAALFEFQQTCREALESGNKRLPDQQEVRPPVFLFLGPPGMGKSHLAHIITSELANSVIVFTASATSELTSEQLDRVTHQLTFQALDQPDVLLATRFFLDEYLHQLCDDSFRDLPITVKAGLTELLAGEFDTVTATRPVARTFRALKESFLPARLPAHALKDKFRRKELTIGPADAVGAWRATDIR
jgi:hypothetical protein